MPLLPQPYRLHVGEEVLDDLRGRLAHTRWPDEIPGSGWRYGASLAFTRRLTARWRDAFDWRAQEARLNAFDQFRVPLGGSTSTSSTSEASVRTRCRCSWPHGWPGSVWEFHELIPRLTDPARFGGDPADAFTVVAPSLSGFPLSFEPGQRRLGIVETADLFARLMGEVLGYPRFAAQAATGAATSSAGSHTDRDKLLGVHLNFLPLPLDMPFPAEPTDEDRAYRQEIRHWQAEEAGYSLLQGTRPQTPAYALTDSPTGLAAWIAEKFYAWSDRHDDLELRSTSTGCSQTSRCTGSAGRSTRRSGPTTRPATSGGPFLSRPPPHRPPTRRSRARSGTHRARSTGVQHPALDRDAARRTLRGSRSSRAARRRRDDVLPRAAGALTAVRRPAGPARSRCFACGHCDRAKGTRPGAAGTRAFV
jgi:hypothetical protein